MTERVQRPRWPAPALLAALLSCTLAMPALAQDEAEDFVVVLPDYAQKCVLPASPDAIPENATLDQLKEAKADIAQFQDQVEAFRGCLQEAEANPENTPGNKQALVRNYEWYLEHLDDFEGQSGVSHRVPWKQGILGLAKAFF